MCCEERLRNPYIAVMLHGRLPYYVLYLVVNREPYREVSAVWCQMSNQCDRLPYFSMAFLREVGGVLCMPLS